MSQSPPQWPRIRDLPEDEREPFSEWLIGQTCPDIEGAPLAEQDGYYRHDYESWKRLTFRPMSRSIRESHMSDEFRALLRAKYAAATTPIAERPDWVGSEIDTTVLDSPTYWPEGCILECRNDTYHYRVIFFCYWHTHLKDFEGEVIESIRGGMRVGAQTRFVTEGFTKIADSLEEWKTLSGGVEASRTIGSLPTPLDAEAPPAQNLEGSRGW